MAILSGNITGKIFQAVLGHEKGIAIKKVFVASVCFLLVAFNSLGQTITTTLLNPNSVCIGTTTTGAVAVTFTITGTFISPNTFTAQLSNSSGSFATPVNIGTRVATTAGTINATIPANTPGGTGYRIRVISSNPSVTSDPGLLFTINLTSITLGPNPTVCSGTTSANLTYSATSGNPDQYSIVYNAAAISAGFANVTNASLGSSPIVLTVPAGATPNTYFGTLTVRNSINSCVSSTYNIRVIIQGAPTIILGPNPSACQGNTIAVLSYSGPTGGPDQYSIDYDVTAQGAGFADVNNASLQASPISLAVPAGAPVGTYNAVLTIRNSTTGCASVNYPFTVTVSSPPVPTITGLNTVCQGTVGYLYSTEPGMTGYSWSIEGGTIDSPLPYTNTVSVTWNTYGTHFINVSYQDPISLCLSQPTTYIVTVNPSQIPLIAGNISVCMGSSGNTYTTQAAMSNYLWTITGGTITGGGTTADNSVTVTWNTPGMQSVAVNFTNSYGCTRPAASILNVDVHPLPVPVITGSATACIGSTGNVYTTGAGMSNYTWAVSAGGTVTSGGTTSSNTVTVTWNTTGPQTVSVGYTDLNGCTSASPTVYNINVNALPTPTLNGPNPACEGSTGNLYITEAGMTGYVWTVSAGGTITSGGGSTDNTATVTWNTAGSRNVTVRYNDANGCTSAPVVFPLTVTVLPTAIITYTGSPWCTDAGLQNVTLTGTGGYLGGTYSALPSGLDINPATGTINPATSTQGTYTVSYTIPAAGGCNQVIVTTSVTITSRPSGTIIYIPNSRCSDAGIVQVTSTATPGGTYTALPAGLSIDAATGAVNTGTSTPGTYTVTYRITPSGGCSPFSTTATITITRLQVATFSYTGTPYCQNASNPSPVFSGGGVAGTFSASPAGLVFVSTATGQVNLAASTPGTYTVTNTIPAAGACPVVTATSTITITSYPSASFSYTSVSHPSSAYCADAGIIPVNFSGTTGGTFTAAPAGLSLNSTTGAVNTGTSSAGSYTVTYTIPASGGCSAVIATAPVTVNALPLADTGPDRSICTGASTQIGAPLITGHTYSWTSNPAGFTSTLSNPTVSPAVNTVYTLTETITATGCTRTNSVTVTANQVLVVTITPPAQTICSGQSTNIQLSSNIIGTTYTWSPVLLSGSSTTGFSAGSGPLIAQTITNNSGGPSVVQYTITANSGTCANSLNTVNITINPLPVRPTISAGGPVAFCLGGSVVLTSSSATGNQWNLNGSPIIGATGQNYTATTGGSYTVTVSDANGCSSTSDPVTTTITPTPAITPITAVGCSGVAFSVTPVDGTNGTVPPGTTYTWAAPVVTGGMTGGATGSGAAAISGTLTNPTTSIQTATYTVTPVGVACTGSPFTVTVTVNPRPVIFNMTAAVCSGTGFTSSPVDGINGAVPSGTTYSWGAPTVTGGMTGGVAGSNQPNITGTLVNPTNTVQTATYNVTPSYSGCAGNVFTLTVSVNPMPSVNNLTTVVCEGGAFTVTPVNGTNGIIPAGTVYSWPSPVVTGGLTGGAPGTNASAISGTLVNPTNSIQTATYTVTPVSPAGPCTGSTFTVTVTVNPVPDITNITRTVCSGSSFDATPVDGTNGAVPPGTTYSWSAPVNANLTGLASGSGSSNISATLTNLTNTVQTVTYTITPVLGSCSGNAFTITVTVNPRPSIANRTASTCGGVPFTITPVNGGGDIVPAGTTYTWPSPTLQAGLTGGAAGNNASNISGTIVNTTNNPLTATYSVTPSYNGCSGNTFTIVVTVNPAPAISNKTASLCSGTVFTVSPVNGPDVVPAGTTYSWPAPAAQGGVGGLAAGTNQPAISATLTNSNSTPRTVVYTVTPSISGCTGSPFTVTVTINPSPPTYNVSFYQFNNVDYFQRCDGQDVYTQNDMDILLPPNDAQPPANYFQGLGYTSWRWESSSTPSGPWVAASGTLTVYHQFILPVPPSPYSPIGDYYFRLAVYNNGYGCSSISDVIHLSVTSTLTIEAGGPSEICQGSGPTPLTGATILGNANPASSRGGTWSITSGGGTLSNYGFVNNYSNPNALEQVTYTPAPGYTGTVTLTLTSVDPDGTGSNRPCLPLVDTRTITVLPAPTVAPGNTINACTSSTPAPITMTGAGFGGGASTAAWSIVSLTPANGGNNGTLSTLTQTADPSAVTYTPPANYSGTVRLRLTTNAPGNCTAATATRDIVINPSPSCSITGNNNVCPGSTNQYSGPAGMSTYSWSITSGTATISGSSTSQNVSVVAPANCSSYELSLTITNSNNCSSTCAQTFTSSDTQLPAITCPALANPTQVDANNGTTYVHSGTSWNATATDNCGTPVLIYTMSGATTGTGTTLNNAVFNEGLTTVTWSTTDLCNNSATCSFNINVNASSDVSVTKTASPSPANAGAELTYTIVLTNTGTASAHNVVLTDNITAFSTIPQYSTSLSGPWNTWTGSLNIPDIAHNGTYTVYIRGTVLCSNLSNTASVTSSNDNNALNNSSTVTTQVIDQEYPDVTCPPLQQVCTISGNTYTNTGTAWDAVASDDCGVASLTYTLSGATTGTGSGATQTLNGVSFNPGVTIVTWRVTDLSGKYAECAFNVTVNLNDECSVTGPDNVCPGSTNTYSGPATVYPYNPYSYSWSVTSGSAVIIGSNTTRDVQVQAPGTLSAYTLSLTVTNLCGTTTCTHTYQVVSALPTVTVNSPTVCDGIPATITATPGTPGTYNYSWTVPAGVPAPGNVASFSTTIAGTYTVIISDQTTLCPSNPASGTVSVNPSPVTSPIYHQ